MNKRKWSIFVIIYTLCNIGVLIGFNHYFKQAYKNTYSVEQYVEQSEEVKLATNENIENYLSDGSSENAELNKSYSNNNFDKIQNEKNNEKYESDKDILKYTINNGSKVTNYNSSGESVRVFKVNAEKIISDLNVTEKAKILWVCRKLSKDEYNKIEEYLSYSNEKLGVLKVYDILDDKLDEEILGELKDIFLEYIDVDKVKEIYY